MKFKKNKRTLKHAALNPSYPDVVPSKTNIPDWYKTQEKILGDSRKIKELPIKLTFKACSPFSESFISGYQIPLAVDIAIQQTPGGPSITWADPVNRFVNAREIDHNKNLPAPAGFSENHFAWLTQHVLEIPEGYSALFTHPLNRYDLPFLSLSGIVDGGITLHEGNFPVYFKKDFEGVILAGTPILQIILFKTENWTSEKNLDILAKANINSQLSQNTAMGWYKKNFWKKKSYN